MPTTTSGIDRIQVAETDVAVGDILQDWDLSNNVRLEVLEIRREREGTTGTVRYISLRNVDTGEPVEWMWRHAISNQTVVGGPKLEDVRRNPSAYPKHLSHHIWKANIAKQFAVAS